MAAAWSFSRSAHRPLSRLVSALSLDGLRLASEITIRFTRSLADETADAIADEAARVTSEILGEQIAQGKVPLSRSELLSMVEDRTAQTVGKVAELRIPTLYLVADDGGAHSTSRTRAPLVPPSTPVPGNSALNVTAPPPASTGLSGQHVISVPSVRTLWRLALSGCQPGAAVAQLGHLLGPPLRDSAAAVIFRAASVSDPSAFDRMSLFDQKNHAVVQMQRETTACFLAALFRVFTSGRVSREVIGELVEAAGVTALEPEPIPRHEIGRYATSESPVRDLATRLAAILESPREVREIQNVLTPYCEHLRTDLWHVAHEVRRLRGIA
jgi:hypothetical protein